jgi:hypothetical protein
MHSPDASPAGFEPSAVAALPSSLSESAGDRRRRGGHGAPPQVQPRKELPGPAPIPALAFAIAASLLVCSTLPAPGPLGSPAVAAPVKTTAPYPSSKVLVALPLPSAPVSTSAPAPASASVSASASLSVLARRDGAIRNPRPAAEPPYSPWRDLALARAWMVRAQRAAQAKDWAAARSALRAYDLQAQDNPFASSRAGVVKALAQQASRRIEP